MRMCATLNKNGIAAVLGCATEEHAPGRTTFLGTEPYEAAHVMLLALFRAVTVYNDAIRGDQSELSAWRLSRTRWSLSARQPRMTWPPLASR